MVVQSLLESQVQAACILSNTYTYDPSIGSEYMHSKHIFPRERESATMPSGMNARRERHRGKELHQMSYIALEFKPNGGEGRIESIG